MEDVVLIVDIGIIQHYFKRQVNKGDVAWPPARQRCSKSLYYCIEKRKISRISPNPSKTNKTTTTEWLNLKPKKWVTSVLNTPHPYKISLTNVATELRFLLTSFVPKKWENVVLSSPRRKYVFSLRAMFWVALSILEFKPNLSSYHAFSPFYCPQCRGIPFVAVSSVVFRLIVCSRFTLFVGSVPWIAWSYD